MKDLHTVNFYKGKLKFAAGHFTIFSATQRETLHGHSYYLHASMSAEFGEPGITFDYRFFTDKLAKLCDQLNTKFLLPEFSPYLKITEQGNYYHAEFNGKQIPFLKEDVLILPITNVTLEELSQWFITEVTKDKKYLTEHKICGIKIKVFNAPEHSASALWRAETKT